MSQEGPPRPSVGRAQEGTTKKTVEPPWPQRDMKEYMDRKAV